jgi:hypothetical protein
MLEYDMLPVNDALLRIMELGEAYYKTPVEIEFAATLGFPGSDEPNRLGILQIRPMKQARALPLCRKRQAEISSWRAAVVLVEASMLRSVTSW